MDPTLDSQIVRMSKIGPCQTDWPLCIHVVVYHMIIITCQSHSYLIISPLIGLTWSKKTSLMTTPKHPGVQIWQMKPLWPMDPPYQSRDALHTSTCNLADESTLADGLPMAPEQRCLEYQYTKLGRWTYVGQWTPNGTRAEMPWIPVHQTWQMSLLWPMDPLVPEQGCLEYQYTKIGGRWTYFGWWTPQYSHLVVKNGNFTLLLTSSGHKWQLTVQPADLPPLPQH